MLFLALLAPAGKPAARRGHGKSDGYTWQWGFGRVRPDPRQKSATGVARHRSGERETIGSVATRALTEDSVEMEFLADDPVAQAVTCQRVTFDARAPRLRPLRLRYCWAG